ncbi:hypothetical protein [Mangrovibacterium marinum]|uniref:hypothetical protein n=1 Tax=Mangrovibacterium marinum TaxID=1639118 RepID=UPI002A18959C|nr:hypothetical protein [Mangrovibacterium marinum]
MNHAKYINRTVYTFHQWKGKGYAVFASLGKLVRIGKLSATISQSLSAKDANTPAAFLNWMAGSGTDEESEEFTEPLLPDLLALLPGIQPVLIAINTNSDQKQPLVAAYWICYFLIEVRFLQHAGNGLFYCCKS